jgi:hypothetical protein
VLLASTRIREVENVIPAQVVYISPGRFPNRRFFLGFLLFSFADLLLWLDTFKRELELCIG